MLVGAFIAISIMLALGVQILSGVNTSIACEGLQGYNSGGADAEAKYPAGTWAGTCYQVQEQAASSFTLMTVILVVVAAVVILIVIKYL